MPKANLTFLCGGAVAGVDGEAGRVRAMVGLGEEGGELLWQVESRLLLSLLSTTFLACSSPRASSAAPFFRRRWRRERSSLRPVEISSTQYEVVFKRHLNT